MNWHYLPNFLTDMFNLQAVHVDPDRTASNGVV